MEFTKLVIFLIILLFSSILSASISDSEVSTYEGEELKWEDGAYGYHVMFKSNLELDTENGLTCADEETGTTYTLDSTHIPEDALIKRAFLVWSGGQPLDKYNDVTDNEVELKFNSTINGSLSLNETITAKKAYKTTESADFEYEAIRDEKTSHSFFTYRADITDFFKEIHKKGRYLGFEYDGYSLYGDYNVSGQTCASDASYVKTSEMLSDWSIVLIYVSKKIPPRNIYLYHEFASRSYDKSEMYVTGFEFPKDPKIKITMVAHLGEPDIFKMEHPEGEMAPPELIQVQGDQIGYIWLTNKCNPESIAPLGYIETFNSISSVYGWYDKEPTCIETEHSMDVDTFLLDSSKDIDIAAHFSKGGERIGLQLSANEDKYISNYMIVETDTRHAAFDIPEKPELVACTPANEDERWCHTNLPYAFAVRIQNWGDNYSEKATLRVEIPEGMGYIPESTMMATRFDNIDGKLIGLNWKKIDDIEGEFPFKNDTLIADQLLYCDVSGDYLTGCDDNVMIKFKTYLESGTPFTDVFEINAYINDISQKEYKTNRGFPVILRYSSSKCATEQDDIDLSNCGGNIFPDTCTSDVDCEEFECCYIEDGASIGLCTELPCEIYSDDDSYDYDTESAPDEDPASENIDSNITVKSPADGCGCSII